MLHVSDCAKEVLFQRKLAHVTAKDMSLRLASSRSGGLGLVAGRRKAGDQVVMHGDEPVLFVDARLSELVLAGKAIDCRKTDEGALELVLRGVARAA